MLGIITSMKVWWHKLVDILKWGDSQPLELVSALTFATAIISDHDGLPRVMIPTVCLVVLAKILAAVEGTLSTRFIVNVTGLLVGLTCIALEMSNGTASCDCMVLATFLALWTTIRGQFEINTKSGGFK
jgi:hypothetical protein